MTEQNHSMHVSPTDMKKTSPVPQNPPWHPFQPAAHPHRWPELHGSGRAVAALCLHQRAHTVCVSESGFSHPRLCERHMFLCGVGSTLLHFHCRWVFCGLRAHVHMFVLRTGIAKGLLSENQISEQHCTSPLRKKEERSGLEFDFRPLLGAQRDLLVIFVCIFLSVRSFRASRICFW